MKEHKKMLKMGHHWSKWFSRYPIWKSAVWARWTSRTCESYAFLILWMFSHTYDITDAVLHTVENETTTSQEFQIKQNFQAAEIWQFRFCIALQDWIYDI